MFIKKSILGLVLVLTCIMEAKAQVKIGFEVSFKEPQAHYAEVQMDISGLAKDYVDVKMPVWTPGSYLIREFEKSVEEFKATASGKAVKVEKVRKNTWRIFSAKAAHIKINYRVYAFEISVRTPFIDESHAFLSPTGIFMHPDGMIKSPSTVKIIPFNTWSKVSTGLEPVAGQQFTYHATDFDILYDSPIEVGNQDVFEFMAAGVRHEVAMYGGGNYDKEKLKVDMAKIVEEPTKVYGENPNKHYVFIVHNFLRGGGGLEHLNSTTLGATRNAYNTEAGYKGFLALVAHEYHHLWNVKRLRPVALGPFDYDNENYTTNLWVAEGFTSYYENKYMHRAGFNDAAKFVNDLAGAVGTVVNTPGAKYQSAASSSYDAWIIGYRPNENSRNNSISYYNKGEVVGILMDLEIINATKGAKSLDDVMKAMYLQCKTLKRGYTDAEFKAMVEKVAGISFTNFWAKYVNGVDDVEYQKYFKLAGVDVTTENATPEKPVSGVNGQLTNAGTINVTSITRNSAAWDAGLNVNDEIISLDDKIVNDALESIKLRSAMLSLEVLPLVTKKKIGDVLKLKVMRDGIEKEISLTLKENPNVRLKATINENATPEQKAVFAKWLGE
ncbi:putative metalloprotease with PDZ domain [Pedobacter psychrotolerans]|uniref:Peptidase M61 n=1 Tax=Pedobacter psychrotolerans TaxID=1843235 RepID=A0A4R2H9F3_9SPHI|nr:PDZ domain-containing protein [Pedobacter psychrotolerans]TCO23679.1 putative metalloprotease with PDZ domain [Pedobacter psychrotolerans]GGE61783.1 peptidase M61 [Pedobacter psychrotolerans]